MQRRLWAKEPGCRLSASIFTIDKAICRRNVVKLLAIANGCHTETLSLPTECHSTPVTAVRMQLTCRLISDRESDDTSVLRRHDAATKRCESLRISRKREWNK